MSKQKVNVQYDTMDTPSPTSDNPSSSTPQKKPNEKSKKNLRHTSPEAILDTFKNEDLTRAEWKKMADQVFTWGVQPAAEEILTSRDVRGEDNYQNTPSGFSDESGEKETSV